MTYDICQIAQKINHRKKYQIAFQGVQGAYSHMAANAIFPNHHTIACLGFDDVFSHVINSHADFGIIPIENILGGRVAEIHHLLPNYDLHIIGEYFLPVHHCLMTLPTQNLEDITIVNSHIQALMQCRHHLKEMNLQSHPTVDTAGAAKDLSLKQEKHTAVIASQLAADIYNLKILHKNFEDKADNVTRFLVLSRDNYCPNYDNNKQYITSMIFGLRSIPAALYKALGGFATNGLNFIKLESYIGLDNQQASFYAEIEAHPQQKSMQHAMEELCFFTNNIKLLGTYQQSLWRRET